MIFSTKRNWKGINDFGYQLIHHDGSISEIFRSKYEGENKKEYTSYVYESATLEPNFKLSFYRKFKDPLTNNNFHITKAAEAQIGKETIFVSYCIQKGINLFKNEYYWQINYLNKNYKCYRVGLNKKGTFYCIYENDEIIAMIVKNYKPDSNSYGCYAYENVPIEILLIFNIFFDLYDYYANDNLQSRTFNTWQKWLLNKYDENFISKIKQLESN